MTLRLRGKSHLLISIILSIIVVAVFLHQILSNFNFKGHKSKSNDGETFTKPISKAEEVTEKKDPSFLPYSNDQPKMKPFNGEKLIHLDLKGAPPLVSYYSTFFPYIKNLGATGLLIEYEDMFPYQNDLEEIKAENAYQPSEIQAILDMAKENNLIVIPLIQTFGHFEFVLKLENFRELREVDLYPQVLCPTHKKIKYILQEMIKQVLLSHPESKYIHIGCDEVYNLGQCNRCSSILKENDWDDHYLFLTHVIDIVTHISNTYPGVRPILWGDMFAKISQETIKQFNVHKMADLMVWKYTTNVSQYITNELLDFYASHFKTIWIASAFKGSTGAGQIVTNAKHHLMNVMSWIDIVRKWEDRIHFKGIAVTGWQRYDHFAALCELLPVGIPSLTLSLQYLKGVEKDFNEDKILDILQCNGAIGFTPDEIANLPFAKCNFPGYPVFYIVSKFYSFSTFLSRPDSSLANGWFSIYNVVHKFSSPAHVEDFLNEWPLKKYLREVKFLKRKIDEALSLVYDEHTVDEWLLTYVSPLELMLEGYYRAQKSLLEATSWPRRPLLNGTRNLQKAMSKICSFDDILGCGLLLI